MADKDGKKPVFKKWWFWAIVVVVVVALGSQGMSEEPSNTPAANTPQVEQKVDEKAPEEEGADPVQGAEEEPEAEKEPDVPTEYTSALAQADTYANMMYMSKQGVYDQLVSEYGGQFTPEAAQYAIDNVEADWNANALEKAKTYQDKMHMSPAAIYDQLISEYGEQFTAEEAQYAVDNLS